MEFFPSDPKNPPTFKGTTLILPSVSVANIGQLVADLLVATLDSPRVGYLENENVLPCVGNDPYDPAATGCIALGLELYLDKERNITILQQRSPPRPGAQKKYAEEVAAWVLATGFREVVILAGVDAGWRTERQIGLGLQLCHLSSSQTSSDTCHPKWSEQGIQELPESTFALLSRSETRMPPWPLFEAIEAENTKVRTGGSECHEGVEMSVLVAFCSEGNNIPEALTIGHSVAHFLKLLDGAGGGGVPEGQVQSLPWKMPPSWAHLYGPPIDHTLF